MLFFYMSMLLLSALTYLGLLPYLLGFRRRTYATYLRSIGLLGFSRSGLMAIAAALMVTGLYLGWQCLLSWLLPSMHQSTHYLQWSASSSWIFLITGLEAPLVEETAFRGLIIFILQKRFPAWFALLWSALLFGIIHLSFGLPKALTVVVGAGIGWGIIRIKIRSIWPGAVLHYLSDGLSLPVAIATLAMVITVLLEPVFRVPGTLTKKSVKET
ncbi:CPBP family intramembrane glutamic endopeptidase [Ktedonosporobacter rubrisoli]|nr:CPBP family intramembrane glutamic endopeptidase [Ktedonosporobacter rubrisoli]